MTTFKAESTGWRVDQRVAREDSDELGTVVEAPDGALKVRWDGGRTSYFKRYKPSNVRLMNIIE
jgi:hypothetical protein